MKETAIIVVELSGTNCQRIDPEYEITIIRFHLNHDCSIRVKNASFIEYDDDGSRGYLKLEFYNHLIRESAYQVLKNRGYILPSCTVV